MKRRVRPILALLALTALALANTHRVGVEAQGRAVTVLATVLDAPVLGWATRTLTSPPRVEDVRVAGQAATVARPAHGRSWPAVVFVNGATELGRRHPDVQRLVRGLARAGYLAVVPDLPGLRRAQITTRTLRATVAVARAVVARPDARGGRVALFGVSVGATLALLTAEEPGLRRRVTVVAGVAPYTDLREVARLATTGVYRVGGRLVRYDHDGFVLVAVRRSFSAAASTRASRRALTRLLRNRDPRRFGSLYAALAPGVRRDASRLSPVLGARALLAPVELASEPHDKYFPVEQSRALARRAPHAQVTITSALSHAIVRPSLRNVDDLLRLDAFLISSLERAYR